MMRSLTCLVLTVLALTRFEAQVVAQNVDLAGTYRCEGLSPNGNPYRTVVEILKDDQTYVVRWHSRENPAIGIGMLRNDTLSVSYFTGKDVGIVVYRIEKGTKLVGQWSILGADGQVYPEILTKVGLSAEQREDGGPFAAGTAAQERTASR